MIEGTRRREARVQAALGIVVHQEADGAAVHAVDRLGRHHRPMQGLQHQAVAAQGDDDVGLLDRNVAVAVNELQARRLGLRRGGRNEADRLVFVLDGQFARSMPAPLRRSEE